MTSPSESLRRLLAGRRSVRRYRPGRLTPEVVHRLLEAATLAPSAHNRQPWRFAVVEGDEARRALAQAMGERFLEDLRRDNLDELEIGRRVARSRERLLSAPALIVVCLTMEGMDVYRDTPRRKAEYLMAVQSVALATGNLLLAVHAEGLGACWMCAPLFAPEAVARALSLPAGWEPQAILTLGVPDVVPPSPGRRPIDEVTQWR